MSAFLAVNQLGLLHLVASVCNKNLSQYLTVQVEMSSNLTSFVIRCNRVAFIYSWGAPNLIPDHMSAPQVVQPGNQ